MTDEALDGSRTRAADVAERSGSRATSPCLGSDSAARRECEHDGEHCADGLWHDTVSVTGGRCRAMCTQRSDYAVLQSTAP